MTSQDWQKAFYQLIGLTLVGALFGLLLFAMFVS